MDGQNIKLRIPRFSTIGVAEKINLTKALRAPLSGYLGGEPQTGYFVDKLQADWCAAFGVTHAIACNSATSGLLAACMAIGIGPGDTVWTTAYSMSATAACAKVLGATIVFMDIETQRFSIDMNQPPPGIPKCIIVTNLFGHPAYLATIRSWCDSNKVWMIEDNAQAPFAMEDGKYAGTVGHIGVFSLNVHKHIQCGEGGVVVTEDDTLADSLGHRINHGELSNADHLGLNLRMTEPTAAIACAQLAKAPKIIAGRIELAETLTDMVKHIDWIKPPYADTDCKHVYYQWAALLDDPQQSRRSRFTGLLQQEGFPMKAGYSKPLHGIFEPFMQHRLPTVEWVEYKAIITFEICAWNPTKGNLKRMREIINRAAGVIDERI